MLSHFRPISSQKEIDNAFDKVTGELKFRYYRFRYAPPLPKTLVIQTIQVIRDNEVVFTLDVRAGDISLSDLMTLTGRGLVEEVYINNEMVYLRVDGVALLNRFSQ